MSRSVCRSVFDNFQHTSFAQFGRGRCQDGPQGMSRFSLFADDFAQIAFSNTKFQDSGLLAGNLPNVDFVGMIQPRIC